MVDQNRSESGTCRSFAFCCEKLDATRKKVGSESEILGVQYPPSSIRGRSSERTPVLTVAYSQYIVVHSTNTVI
jgi:hypothetical protein